MCRPRRSCPNVVFGSSLRRGPAWPWYERTPLITRHEAAHRFRRTCSSCARSGHTLVYFTPRGLGLYAGIPAGLSPMVFASQPLRSWILMGGLASTDASVPDDRCYLFPATACAIQGFAVDFHLPKVNENPRQNRSFYLFNLSMFYAGIFTSPE